MTHSPLTAVRARAPILSRSNAQLPCTCAAILLSATAATPALGNVHTTSKAQRAQATRSTSVNDKSTLHRVKVIGNTLIEEGNAEGTLKGRVKISLYLGEVGSTTSHIVMYLPGGDLFGHANGKATTPKEDWESFGGKMWIDHGTGRYAHASGSGTMYGALNRHTYALVVHVTGQARGL